MGNPACRESSLWGIQPVSCPWPLTRLACPLGDLWRQEISSRILENLERLRTTLKAFQVETRLMRRAFNSWSAHHEQLVHMRRALLHLICEGRSRAFATWAETVQQAGFVHERLYDAVVNSRRRELRRAIDSWIDIALLLGEAREALRCMRYFQKRSGWRTWAEFASEAAAQAAQLHAPAKRAARILLNRELSRAFNGWCEPCGRRRRMLAAVMRLMRQELLKSYNSWKVRIAELAMMTRALTRFARQAEAAALLEWRSVAEQTKRQMQGIECIVRAMLVGSKFLAALNKWIAVCANHKLLVRVCRALLVQNLKRGLSTWLAFALARQDALAAVSHALAAARDARRRAWNTWAEGVSLVAPMRVALVRLQNRAKVGAWMSWRAHAAERRVARRAFARWLALGLGRVLSTWTEYVRLLGVKRRAAMALRGGGLRRGFHTWAGYAEGVSAAFGSLERASRCMLNVSTSKAFRQWSAECGKLLAMRYAIATLRNMLLKRGFVTWATQVEFRVEALGRLSKAVTALLYRGLRVGLTTWAVQASEAAAQAAQLHAPAKRAARILLNRELSRAFNGWCEPCGRRRRMLAAVMRLMRQELLKSYNSWKVRIAELAMMTRALTRFARQAEAAALLEWRSVAEQTKRQMQGIECIVRAMLVGSKFLAALNKWIAVCANHKLLVRVCRALLVQNLKRGLSTWLAFALARQDALAAVSHALAAARDARRRAWNTWAEGVSLVAPMRVALVRLQNRAKVGAWMSWRAHAAERRVARRAFARWLALGLGRVLSTWTEYVRLLGVKRRAAMALRGGGLRRGFHTWAGYAEGVSAAFGSLERASRCMLNVSTSKAFHTWAGYAEGVSGALQSVTHALGHWTYSLLSIGWHTWATYVNGVDVFRRRLQRIVVQVHALRTGLAFSAWDTWLRERVSRLLAVARRAAAFWLLKGASGAIKRWVIFSTQKHLARRSLDLYVQRHLRVSWRKWALSKHKAVTLMFVLEQDFDTWTHRSSLRFGAFFKQAFGVRLRDVHVRRLMAC